MTKGTYRSKQKQMDGSISFGDVQAVITATKKRGELLPSSFKMDADTAAKLEAMPPGTSIDLFIRF